MSIDTCQPEMVGPLFLTWATPTCDFVNRSLIMPREFVSVWPDSKYAGCFYFFAVSPNWYQPWFPPKEWCTASFLLLLSHRTRSILKYQRKTTWYCVGVWWLLAKSSRIWQAIYSSAKKLTWRFWINFWKATLQMSPDSFPRCMWVVEYLLQLILF